MRNVFANMVPSVDATIKKLKIRILNDILERYGKEPTGLNNVIAGDTL